MVRFALIAAWLSALLLGVSSCRPSLPTGTVDDLQQLPQDPLAYLEPATADQPLLPPAVATGEAAVYRQLWLAPWLLTAQPAPTEVVYWFIPWAQDHSLFHADGEQWSAAALTELIVLADTAGYPSCDLPAITLRDCALRALPTNAPAYLDPRLPGEGPPFDYLQLSALPAGQPLRLRHRSVDGRWLLVESALVRGWLPADAAAPVPEVLVDALLARPLAVLLRDQPVTDADGQPLFQGRLGQVLPQLARTSTKVQVLVPRQTGDGIRLETVSLPATDAAVFPQPLTPQTLATLARPLLGQPYGWGGVDGDRDCSSTLHDLFSPFGLWLPRNSRQQAQRGRIVSLAERTSAEKRACILADGVPWRTLLRLPGHIMLYIGARDGEPLVLHTFWGVRTEDGWGEEGRLVIGRTAITTLEPGRELPQTDPEASLLRRLSEMVLLGEKME